LAVPAAAAMAHRVVYAVGVASTHQLEGHLERPARVDAIVDKLLAAGLTPAACPGQVLQPAATAPPAMSLTAAAACSFASCLALKRQIWKT
jgi:hypothetical protein